MSFLPSLPRGTLRGPRALPLLGVHGNLVRFFRDPVRTLLALHRDHGELCALADRDAALSCAFGPEWNRMILSDSRAFENHAEVPMRVPPDSAPVRLNTALTSMNGEVHRRQRRLIMPAFSRAALEGYRDDMVAVTERHLERLHPGETRDLGAEMIELTLCLATRCLFGLDVTGEADGLGRLAVRYLAGLTSPGAMLLPLAIPGTPYARFLAVAAELERSIRALIQERRAQGPGGRDVLSTLIAARDEEDGSGLSDAELVGQAAVLLIAAHETTAYTLAWTLLLLSQHPEELAALHGELDRVLSGAAPTVAQLGELDLLDRVVKESMRLLPATPFFFLRRATAPFRLREHELPAGAIVLLSSLVTHRLPALYPEPDRFLPERWLGASPPPYAYLPFGAGPRTCVGAGFAAQAIRVVLATLLQRRRLGLAPGARVGWLVHGITFGPRPGLPMRIERPGASPSPGPVAGEIRELVRFPASIRAEAPLATERC